MINHVRDELPNEGCGLIAFDGDRPVKLYPGTNTLASPSRYRMDDAEVLRADEDMEAHGWWLGAIYHSHPASAPVPSITDLREANWPDALMVIISLKDDEPEVRAYRVFGESFEEVGLTVDPPKPWRLNGLFDRALRRLRPGERVPQPAIGPALVGGSAKPAVESQPETETFTPPKRATIGILGGMGPLATVDLFGKIVKATNAATDQEHIPVVIYSDPRVPDRTEALLEDGEDPTPWLIHGVNQVGNLGADFVVMPCNTAHAFLDRIQPQANRPVLSMIESAADMIKGTHPEARTVGLLATNGTISTGIYQKALEERGIETIVPDDETQRRCVMSAIRAVKASSVQPAVTARLVEAANELHERGADVILAACTEIPVVLQQRHLDVPLIDATDALARLAVATARHLDDSAGAGKPQWETGSIDLEGR